MYHHHRLWSSMSDSIRKGYRSAVCTNRLWFSSSSSFSLDVTPPTPYLFFSPTYKGKFFAVFNPSDRRFYDFPMPKELQGPDSSVRGSGQGWMLMSKSTYNNYAYEDDEEEEEEEEGTVSNRKSDVNELIVSLYNPLTRTHIPLPCLRPDFLGHGVVLCNPAKASRGQPLVSIRYGIAGRHIRLYHQGEDHWSWIMTPPNHRIGCTVYHEAENALYVVYSDYRLSVLDLAATSMILRPVIETPSPKIQSLGGPEPRLVVGPAGDLLLFVMDDEECKGLFKLDRRCLKWVRTTSVGDHTFFMADNTVSMVCDPGFTDAHPNQFYYFHQYRARCTAKNRFEVPTDVEVQDLSNNGNQKQKFYFKTKKILVGKPNYLQFASWIVPSLK